MRNLSVAAGMIVIVVATAGGQRVAHAQAPGAFQIRFHVADALVKPLKNPNQYWDGLGPPLGEPPTDAERNANAAVQQAATAIVSGAVHLATGSNPYAAAAQLGAGFINSAAHAPDVYAIVMVDGVVVARTTFVPDSVTPAWTGPTATVSVTPQSLIEIRFMDKDLQVDDQIGVCRWLNLQPHADTYIAVDSECSEGVIHAQILVQPVEAGSQQVAPAQPPTADSPTPTPSANNAAPTPHTGNRHTGFVQVVTPGGWANVLDGRGRPLGQTPVRIEFPAGRQRLRIVPFGTGTPIPVTVTVLANDSTDVAVPISAN